MSVIDVDANRDFHEVVPNGMDIRSTVFVLNLRPRCPDPSRGRQGIDACDVQCGFASSDLYKEQIGDQIDYWKSTCGEFAVR